MGRITGLPLSLKVKNSRNKFFFSVHSHLMQMSIAMSYQMTVSGVYVYLKVCWWPVLVTNKGAAAAAARKQ